MEKLDRKQKNEARAAFDAGIQALFNAQDPDAKLLCAAIQRMLCQFRLSQAYDVRDILVEVYTRGVKLAEQGETFLNLSAWVRRSAYNVVREFRREFDRLCYKDLEDQPDWQDRNPISEQELQDDLRIMRRAFQRLSSADRQILRLRMLQGMSWKEVAQALAEIDGTLETEGNLRQMGSRALKKLRKLFDEEADTVHLDSDDLH